MAFATWWLTPESEDAFGDVAPWCSYKTLSFACVAVTKQGVEMANHERVPPGPLVARLVINMRPSLDEEVGETRVIV